LLPLSAIVATRNSSKTIARCLASLEGFNQVIVIDGHSKDTTLEIARRFNAEIYPEQRKGFFGAYDTGFRKARSDFIMFLDSDAFLKDFDFAKALKQFDDPTIGMVVCLSIAPVSNWVSKLMSDIWVWRNSHMKKYYRMGKMSWQDRQISKFFMSKNIASGASPTGPCFILRRSAIERMGGMNPKGDDFTLGRMLENVGYESRFYISESVYHLPRTSMYKLCREYARFGLRGGQIAMNFYTTRERAIGFLMTTLSFAAAPYIAKDSRDVRHLLLIPTIRAIQGLSYLIAILLLDEIPNTDYNAQMG